ncbi:MAG TPA: hypothetical protein DCQ98_06165 [Planctomycetaceae bacterium]|nr:hypothetical protein [Planctomycetaceae bacterium]
MPPASPQDASHVGPVDDIDAILSDAERLCRTIAGDDLETVPVYLLPQSRLPVGLATKHHYAFTHPRADLIYREHIPMWRGRGPCAVINDLGIAEDFEVDDHAYVITALVLHELAHMLDRPALFDQQGCDDPNRLKFDAMVLAETSQRAALGGVPAYWGHGPSFLRIAIHLAYRACRAGFAVRPAGVVATSRLGLSPMAGYEETLGDEPRRLRHSSLRQLAVTPPPHAFTRQWRTDLRRFQDQTASNPECPYEHCVVLREDGRDAATASGAETGTLSRTRRGDRLRQ